jgi:hypothetical protein
VALPVRLRFSRVAAKVKVTEDCTVSEPLLPVSVMLSERLSTR